MTDEQIAKRTDEFYDMSKKHTARVKAAAARQAKALPADERQAHVSGAIAGAGQQLDKRFAHEFGSTTQRTPSGAIVRPKHATQGHLHDTRADAEAVAARVPFDAAVRQVGEKYAVLPKVAVDRLREHKAVGTSPAIGAKVFRTSGKLFRNAVLPLSAKWLTGQAVEAGVRSGVAGAGPMSLLREHRTFKALEVQKPGAGIEMRQRALGGHFGLTGTAREFATGQRSLADEFAGTGLAKPANVATKVGQLPGAQKVRQGWRNYTHVVFDVVNGAIEHTAQKAMTGKALKTSPLMERHVIGLSDKAVHEAARGLHATENQVALGRAVDRMYGAYAKFSPAKRETLLHSTPFYPWYANSAKFLLKVLPADHPVTAAVIANANVLEADWRKAHHQSLADPKHVPGFLLGGYPAGADKTVRLGRYTPFGASADPAQSVADLFLPQFSGAQEALRGIDWTGNRMKHPGYKGKEFTLPERLAAAAATEASVLAPGVAQLGRITGVEPKFIEKKNVPADLHGKRLLKALRKEVDPFMATGKSSGGPTKVAVKKGGSLFDALPPLKPVRIKPIRVKPIRINPLPPIR